MKRFEFAYSRLLKEFNVEDRNDPSFYDYVVTMLQQFKQRNLLPPDKLIDIRKTAQEIIKKGFYNFIDENNTISQKVSFIFDGDNKDLNNLQVRIYNNLSPQDAPKVIDNTHEESSIAEIGDYIETKRLEAKEQEQAGTSVPAEVSETPSELPDAVSPADTSQYLKGL